MSKRVQNGSIAEAIFLKRSIQSGYKISIPFSHDVPYDFILDNDEEISKIQVKKAYNATERGKKVISCELRRVGNTGIKAFYENRDFDYLVAVHCESEAMWFIPMHCIKENRSGIRVSSKKWDKYKV